jgi:hypothetical protein
MYSATSVLFFLYLGSFKFLFMILSQLPLLQLSARISDNSGPVSAGLCDDFIYSPAITIKSILNIPDYSLTIPSLSINFQASLGTINLPSLLLPHTSHNCSSKYSRYKPLRPPMPHLPLPPKNPPQHPLLIHNPPPQHLNPHRHIRQSHTLPPSPVYHLFTQPTSNCSINSFKQPEIGENDDDVCRIAWMLDIVIHACSNKFPASWWCELECEVWS